MKTTLTILLILTTLTTIKGQMAGTTFDNKGRPFQNKGLKITFYDTGVFTSIERAGEKMYGRGKWINEDDTLKIIYDYDDTDILYFVFKDSLTLIETSKEFRLPLHKFEEKLESGRTMTYEYDEKWKLTSIKTHNKNNILVNWRDYDGNKINEKTFSELGILQSKGTWKKDIRIGEWSYYNDKGELIETKKY